MMNGDSLPSPNAELIYEMRATVPMVDKGIQFTPDCLGETRLNHNVGPPARNVSVRSVEHEEAIESADEPPLQAPQPRAKVSADVLEQIDCDPDRVDAKWPALEPSGPDDDGCGVRCLSYTVQCCDCVIL